MGGIIGVYEQGEKVFLFVIVTVFAHLAFDRLSKMAVNRIRGAFAPPRKGETFELRAGLVSQYAYERKESIQKTIMAMTLGKDVSALFPDVLKNIATGDLDQKKLVYLYLM